MKPGDERTGKAPSPGTPLDYDGRPDVDRRQPELGWVMQGLRSLRLLHTQLSEVNVGDSHVEPLNGVPNTAVNASVSLIKQMLSETQARFRSMMEDNQLLGSRVDAGLHAAQAQVNDLRTELADTHKMIHQLAAATDEPGRRSHTAAPQGVPKLNGVMPTPAETRAKVGGAGEGSSEPRDARALQTDDVSSDEDVMYHDKQALLRMDQAQVVDACLSLQSRHRNLRRRAAGLRSQAAALSVDGDRLQADVSQLSSKLKASETEVALAREALAALKADRKRLKSEKFDLLNQMKQLYQTLEDKESELRDFIRNYEQRIQENKEALRALSAERDGLDRERWSVLKRAREEADRCAALSAQLSDRDLQLKQTSQELDQLRRRLSQTDCCSDHESSARSGPPPPPAPAASPASAPAASNGRGSSADSGVRVSSDRDSAAAATSGNLSDSTTSGEVTGPRGSPAASPLTVPPDRTTISRSAEQLDSLEQLERRLRPKGAKQGTWGSISRVFSRQRQRKHLPIGALSHEDAWSLQSAQCPSPLTDESYAEKLRLLEEAQQLPMERWKASMVLAWLQVTLGMPQYGPACAENVRSGKVMLELTDVDLERVLGITQPMHKKKLRLAVEELRQPHLCKYPYISQLNHAWVAVEWLPDIGLAQYADIFSAHLVDGRLLAHLTKKDMEKYLNVTRKFHQVSLMHGIQLLRLLQFDRQIICERRQRSEITGDDVLVWTNARFVQWARAIDLSEYADNLKDSGVHGALVILELSFTVDALATALGIPQSKTMLRRHLAAELDKLVRPARLLLDEETRQVRWERERRRTERPATSATLGRAFSRSYASGLQRRTDRESASLRGSLSRALGLRTQPEPTPRESLYARPREPARPAPPPLERPQSVVTAGCEPRADKQHRRVKSISDMESAAMTPV